MIVDRYQMEDGNTVVRHYRLLKTPPENAWPWLDSTLAELLADGWQLIGSLDVDPGGFGASFAVQRPRLRLVKA